MASDLPDDPSQWPSDSFEMLGVRRGATDAEIKRAYIRLIRRFKPEHAPDAFRLIRESYEDCLRRSSWYRDEEPEPTPEAPTEPNVQPPRLIPRPSDSGFLAGSDPDPYVPAVDPVDRLWTLAVAGNLAEAYRGLAERAAAEPMRVDLSLRLYWLLAVSPALDPVRTRHHWLADALTWSGLRHPAAELYRRELDDHPDAALQGPYSSVLHAPAETDDLVAVVRWRVAAAGRQGDASTIETDLEAVRDRLCRDHDVAWLGLLVNATEWLAWRPSGPGDAYLKPEFARLRHLELPHAYAFDRLDEAGHMATEMERAERFAPVPLLDLIRVTRAGYHELRPELASQAAAAIAQRSTNRNLDWFDDLTKHLSPGVLVAAVAAFDRHQPMDDPIEFPPDRLCHLARTLPNLGNYLHCRRPLLRLLTENVIDPREMAAACEADDDPRLQSLAHELSGDLPLRLLWLASRLHHARNG